MKWRNRNMKKYSIFALIALVASLSSCKNKVEEPDTADFNWYIASDYNANMLDLSKAKANPDTIELSDELIFVAKGTDATSYVVWTGDPGHDFTMRQLPDSLIKDTVNNVSQRSIGLALSSKDAMGRYYKSYKFSRISRVGVPYQMYATARNYDYDKQDYSEVKVGPYPIVAVDSKTDLWNEADPYSLTDNRSYSMSFIFNNNSILVYNKSKGAEGSYELIYEDKEKGIAPGVTVTYPVEADVTTAVVNFKVGNCIPFVEVGTLTYNAKQKSYKWIVDLSTPQTMTLASQSAVEEGYTDYLSDSKIVYPNDKTKIVESKYTKEYVFSAKEYK